MQFGDTSGGGSCCVERRRDRITDKMEWPSIELTGCARNAYAGGIIGTICGFMFGSVDAGKVSGLTTDFATMPTKLRDPNIMKFFFRSQLTTTAMFGGMFSVYQAVRCTIQETTDMEYPVAVGAAAITGVGPFLPSRHFRRSLPWALVLVGMDVYSGGLGNN
mmetsp:Transcript_30547/g.48917  ORF Transcript_30547/g.48917 Transcript_30547/m.48917 type:complete len:162 (+) Transcript_30547:93-578(+)